VRVLKLNVSGEKQECPVDSEWLFMYRLVGGIKVNRMVSQTTHLLLLDLSMFPGSGSAVPHIVVF
jgi:hypothetical protein